MEMDSAQDHLSRLSTLKGSRANFDEIWRQVQHVVWPDGGEFREKRVRGEKKTRLVYEMTAALALEKFAAVMESFLTPRSSQWHRLAASNDELNDDPEVKQFFEGATDALFKIRNSPKARFYGQMHEGWKSQGAYGNSCIYVDEMETGGIRYRHTHVGHAWIEVNFEGVVDTVFYEYELSARSAIQKWGDAAPKSVKSVASSSPDEKHTYVHLVRPNEQFDPDRSDSDAMRFESFDIARSDSAVIAKGGFQELPYIWSRYTLNPNEMYGRGPAMLVLPDIQTLQEMEKVFIRSGHKVADPPLLVANDGVLGRGSKKIRIGPGAINIGGVDANGRQLIQPMQTGARLDLTKEMMDIKRETIKEAFLSNLLDLLARDNPVRTATEILERAKEKGQILTPVIGRQQSEVLGPMIARELAIAQRQGKIGPLPDALIEAQGEYEIVYETDATRMQKSEEGAGFARLLEMISPLIQNDPSLLDKFKGDEAIDHFADIYGVPSSIINTEQEMARIRQSQAQAAQQQQQIDQAEQVSKVAGNISGVAA